MVFLFLTKAINNNILRPATVCFHFSGQIERKEHTLLDNRSTKMGIL